MYNVHVHVQCISITCTCTFTHELQILKIKVERNVHVRDVIFKKEHFPNNFDQTFTFNCTPFHCFLTEVNEIWYPGRATIKRPR